MQQHNRGVQRKPWSPGKFAFAFDIDGVLLRGGKVIPEAIEAMKMLNGDNEYGIKV
jgi:ribonucleotide monophosphatase NagD (HAD superfamily)